MDVMVGATIASMKNSSIVMDTSAGNSERISITEHTGFTEWEIFARNTISPTALSALAVELIC